MRKVPKSLKIDNCDHCGRQMPASDYKQCSVALESHQLFFDYVCSNCRYSGRYVMAIKPDVTDAAALLEMAKDLIKTEQEGAESGESANDILDRIVGVQDLLNLAGNSQPEEHPGEPDDDQP